jgi:uncharacterized protein YceK
MRTLRIPRAIALWAMVFSAGCSTVNNLIVGTPPAHGGPIEPMNEVYGGVKTSVQEGLDGIVRPQSAETPLTGLAILAVDTPLSLIGDTLTLPITVPAAIKRRNQRKQDVVGMQQANASMASELDNSRDGTDAERFASEQAQRANR